MLNLFCVIIIIIIIIIIVIIVVVVVVIIHLKREVSQRFGIISKNPKCFRISRNPKKHLT